MPSDEPALFAGDACRDPERALASEWLETDGVGGFASSTIWDCPTRRYHGLLVARIDGSDRRHLFLSRLDPTVTVDGGPATPLATLAWPGGAMAPRGDRHLETFALGPHPTWTWQIGDRSVRREVLMTRGRPAVLCRFSVRGGPIRLELRPALACREADALHYRNAVLDPTTEAVDGGIRVRPYSALPPVEITVAAPTWDFDAAPDWLCGIELRQELARGYAGVEDHWCPGVFRLELADGEEVVVAAALDTALVDPAAAFEAELRVRRTAGRGGRRGPAHRTRLARRADDFRYVAPGGRHGVCAGYPWFGEWGRDTFISLPGLTLARGRLEDCEAVLSGALEFLRDGLLPNIYGRTPATSHYGSVDAALWFARAVDLWRGAGGSDGRFSRDYAPALLEIATAYHDGTGLGVRARDDGLLSAGRPDLNATWMDAQTPDGPVTPRHGLPVEIEALWLALLDQCADLAGEPSPWAARRDRAFARFVELFWLADAGYLADRIEPDGRADPKVRPNMVLAAALHRSPLTDTMRERVLERTERDLLTPRGLRTLAPSDSEYRGVYRGDVTARDNAYHQGTVWPWLLGSYVELALRVRGGADAPRLRAVLDGFAPELDRAGLDHVSEVFDGDPPHHPGGTIAQAWNTAELLRAHRLLDEAS